MSHASEPTQTNISASALSPWHGGLGLLALLTIVSCGPRLVAGEPAKSETSNDATQTPTQAEEPPANAEAAPAQPEPAVRASEVLSAPDKAWVFSFRGSAAYEKAEKRCDERYAEDLAARARCITKARDAFTADAMEFTRDESGRDVWVIYREKQNKMIQIYSVPIEYGEQTGDTVTIRKLGRGTGKALLFPDVQEFKVTLADEYSLQLDDKRHGRLSYDARLGLFTSQ